VAGGLRRVSLAEVDEFGQFAVDDDIGRSEVEVGNIVALQETNGIGDVRGQLETSAGRESLPLYDKLFMEGETGKVVHDDCLSAREMLLDGVVILGQVNTARPT
jgi:hypothetical protein